MKSKECTPRELKFINAYLGEAGGNASKAFRLAGLSARTDRPFLTASSSRMLNRPRVKAEIEKRLRKQAISADEVIYRLSCIARASVFDFFDVDPETGLGILNLKRVKEEGNGCLISKCKHHPLPNAPAGEPKFYLTIEWHSSLTALITLAKILGLLTHERPKKAGKHGGDGLDPETMTPAERADYDPVIEEFNMAKEVTKLASELTTLYLLANRNDLIRTLQALLKKMIVAAEALRPHSQQGVSAGPDAPSASAPPRTNGTPKKTLTPGAAPTSLPMKAETAEAKEAVA